MLPSQKLCSDLDLGKAVPLPVGTSRKGRSWGQTWGVKMLMALAVLAGTFSHVLRSADYTATHHVYAHHSLVHLMVFSITIRRSAPTTRPVTVQLHTPFVPTSQDLDLNQGPDFQGAQ